MGWTSFAMPPEGARAYLDAHVYSRETAETRHTVIDSALVGKREYHAAVERTDVATGTRTVFAGVARVSISTRDGGTLACGSPDLPSSHRTTCRRRTATRSLHSCGCRRPLRVIAVSGITAS